jgi:hypothetical protein
MMKSGKSLGRVGAVLVIVSVAIAAALVGGASTGRAATLFNIELTPLIGTSEINEEIPQVSYGGKIGFHLHILNNDTSTTQHASVVVTSNLATFSDSDNASCILNSKDSHQMICTPFGGTFGPGQAFDVNLRFTAPVTGPDAGVVVKTCASISVSAQTVGGKKNGNNGTTLATTCPNGFNDPPGEPGPVLTNVVENTTKDDTYLHKNEHAETGNLSLPDHPQNFRLDTPIDELLGDPFGIAVSIHDILGAPAECIAESTTDCFGAVTQLKIPAAPSVSEPGNPFYDGSLEFPFNPYSWTMKAQYPQGSNFKLHGVYHIVDGSGAFQQLKECDDPLVGGAPSVAFPLCYDTLDQITNKRMLIATGRGLENGGLGWN